MDELTPTGATPIDAIRHISASGEFWSARELMPLLEYSSWQRFEEAIQRAMADCAKAGRDVADGPNPRRCDTCV